MVTPDLHDSRYSWARLAASLLVGVVANVGMWAVVVVLPGIEAEFGASRGGASLPYTLTMFGYALGSVSVGYAVDRWGMSRALAISALILSGGFLTASMAPSLGALVAVQFLIGLGTAVGFAPMIADISHWFLRRRGIAIAAVASGNYLSGAVWPLILTPILRGHDWRYAYGVIAVVVLALLLPLSLALRRRMDAAGAEHAARQRPVTVSGLPVPVLVAMLALAGVSCCVAMSMPQVHIVALCVDLGFGQEIGARMLSLMLFGGVISRLAAGFVADRLGGIATVLISSTAQGLALFLFIPFDGLASLTAVSLIFGLSQGGIVPCYAMIVREYLPAAVAGRFVGLVMSATILGMALGGWMSGWIFDMTGSYAMAVLNGIGWNVLNILIILTLRARSRPGRMILAGAGAGA